LSDLFIARQFGEIAKVIKRIHEKELEPGEAAVIDAIIEQTPARSEYRLFEQLEAIIRMLVAAPNGLSFLLGRMPPPTTGQINEMILMYSPPGDDLGTRVEGGLMTPQAERLIYTEETFSAAVEKAGGWPHIHGVSREHMKIYPNTWSIIMGHVRWVRTKITRADGSSLSKVADANGVSVETVRNVIRSFPLELAHAILASPREGEFDLTAPGDYPAV
jgi:hypothetical protein